MMIPFGTKIIYTNPDNKNEIKCYCGIYNEEDDTYDIFADWDLYHVLKENIKVYEWDSDPLLISKEESVLLDRLFEKIMDTKHGLITNWNEPYGITFEELKNHIDRIKYGEKYVRKRECERAKQVLGKN